MEIKEVCNLCYEVVALYAKGHMLPGEFYQAVVTYVQREWGFDAEELPGEEDILHERWCEMPCENGDLDRLYRRDADGEPVTVIDLEQWDR